MDIAPEEEAQVEEEGAREAGASGAQTDWVAPLAEKGIGSSKQDPLKGGSRLSAVQDGQDTCHRCKSSRFQFDHSAVSDTCSRSFQSLPDTQGCQDL